MGAIKNIKKYTEEYSKNIDEINKAASQMSKPPRDSHIAEPAKGSGFIGTGNKIARIATGKHTYKSLSAQKGM